MAWQKKPQASVEEERKISSDLEKSPLAVSGSGGLRLGSQGPGRDVHAWGCPTKELRV